MRVSKKERLLDFIPPSQMREVSPAVPAVEAALAHTLEDGTEVPAVEAVAEIPAVTEPIEGAAVFVSRVFKRREYGAILEAIKPDENGDVTFTPDKAYRLAALALHSVRNVECEDEDGKWAPLDLERDEDGRVTDATLDLFDYQDIYAYGLWVLKTARLGEEQGEK